MDEKKHLAFILIIVFVALLFVALYRQEEFTLLAGRVRALEMELSHERSFSDELIRENTELRKDLAEARHGLVVSRANLSQHAQALEICEEEIPTIQDIIGDLPVGNNRVNLSDVIFSSDATIINVEGLVPGIIAPSNSMYPLLREGDIVLEETPESPDDLFIGDIVIYEFQGHRIIHRIVAIGTDDAGWYALAKGDNNQVIDPEKVRFSQIRGVVVGVIY